MDLSVLAQKYGLAVSTALGLGSGLYFEYFHSPRLLPSRSISGLHRGLAQALKGRVLIYKSDPENTLRHALRTSALWFNLDRAPTTGLMGMEMLAEELPRFGVIADYRECLAGMSQTILKTCGLYRQTFADFVRECAPYLPDAELSSSTLREISREWIEFAEQLARTTDDPVMLERAGRMLRRLAFREENFWGSVLEMV